MIEIVLVEGVSDVRLISYYLQNIYGWKHENSNALGITANDEYEHIESLSKQENQLDSPRCGIKATLAGWGEGNMTLQG